VGVASPTASVFPEIKMASFSRDHLIRNPHPGQRKPNRHIANSTTKKQVHARLKQLKEKLKEQSRFCRVARIARVPRVVTVILRLLVPHQLLGRNLQIVGTNALYAYEARDGVFLERSLLATQDMDVLWDIRPKLRLFAIDEDGFPVAMVVPDPPCFCCT
jgi:hypothetical protein